jgi:hypothetical protein
MSVYCDSEDALHMRMRYNYTFNLTLTLYICIYIYIQMLLISKAFVSVTKPDESIVRGCYLTGEKGT